MVSAALSTSCIVIIRLDGVHSLHDLSTSNLLKEPRLEAAFSSAVTKVQEESFREMDTGLCFVLVSLKCLIDFALT